MGGLGYTGTPMSTRLRLTVLTLLLLMSAACSKSDAQAPPSKPGAAFKPLPINVAKAEASVSSNS